MLEKFEEFHAMTDRHIGEKPKCTRFDNSGEYSGPFNAYCKQHGIVHENTPPKISQLNGLAEMIS